MSDHSASGHRWCGVWFDARCAATAAVAARGGGTRRPIFGWTRLLAGHDVIELVAVYGFPIQQGLGHGMHLVAVVLNELARQAVLLVNDIT